MSTFEDSGQNRREGITEMMSWSPALWPRLDNQEAQNHDEGPEVDIRSEPPSLEGPITASGPGKGLPPYAEEKGIPSPLPPSTPPDS